MYSTVYLVLCKLPVFSSMIPEFLSPTDPLSSPADAVTGVELISAALVDIGRAVNNLLLAMNIEKTVTHTDIY